MADTKMQLIDTMPRNLVAERALLGLILQNGKLIYEVYERLLPVHFYKPSHARIYAVMLALFDKGHTPDLVMVTTEFLNQKQTDADVVTPYDLMLLTSEKAHDENLGRLSDVVRENYIKRQAAIEARRFYEKIVGEKIENIWTSIEQFTEKMMAFSTAGTEQKDMSMAAIGSRALRQVQQAMYEGIVGAQSGTEIDEVIIAFKAGKLIGILARPGEGKSAFAAALAHAITRNFISLEHDADPGKPYSAYRAGVVSLEMLDLEFYFRLASGELAAMGYHISYFDIENGRITERELALLNEAVVRLSKRGIYIDDIPAANENEVIVKIHRLVRVYKVQVIFLDHLLLVPAGDQRSKTEMLTSLANRLKALAKELNIAIVPLLQAGRETSKGEPRPPTLADIQWADGIGQALDILITLFRPEYHNPEAVDEDGNSLRNTLIVNYPKHRGGKAGPSVQQKIGFHMPSNSFTDISTEPVVLEKKHLKKDPFNIENLF